MRAILLTSTLCLLIGLPLAAWCQESNPPMNLLLNPRFEFHSFINHRDGKAISYESHDVAFWNTDAWGDITVRRESHVDAALRPDFSTGSMVAIAPGKRLYQFITLPEAHLADGDRVSLWVWGHQAQPGQLRATIRLLKLDSEDGTWKPSDFGYSD